ncbi:polymorphic toxin-type HINT domain-containing protein [Alkanindiges illinoisensis]|uniref:Hint domain-containing protein n=1 Tax=Alkanindiges illinoisensis TaxID=197183 RepID=A0A4Y7XEK1_9GAMM|nr:polymorphic toxin-type HINT domain-containing protein [Alkanindiges illinoisensis]TEU30217.1 hypothetical protein E2B99_02990 [Alkanindiges illinoisensis]
MTLKIESGFAAGTLVHTDQGLVPIEQIKVGDRVLSKPEDGIGAQVYKSVVRTVKTDNVPVRLVKCIAQEVRDQARRDRKYISDDELTNIIVTANHPFWVVGKGWVQAEDLRESDSFELNDGRLAKLYDNGGGMFTAARPIYHFPGDLSGWTIRFNEYGDDEGVSIVDVDLTPGIMRQRDTGVSYRETYLGWYKDHGQPYICTVYNLEVADTHTYYVADLGIWVKTI